LCEVVQFCGCLGGRRRHTVLAAAIASWATTEVTPEGSDVDWWDLFQAEDLHFHDETIDLLDYGTYPNGTAAPGLGRHRAGAPSSAPRRGVPARRLGALVHWLMAFIVTR
jgi:hypothetical protein